MSTIINATTTNGVVIQPDNSGSLVLQTNSGTTALTIDTAQNVTLSSTGAIKVPTGTTAQRPASPTNGMTRYNTTTGQLEVYNTASGWANAGTSGVSYSASYLIVAGGGGGGASNAGGGGAGGLLSGTTTLTIGTTYSFTVGAGATAISGNTNRGNNGNDSIAFSLTAIAGGGGGAQGGTAAGKSGGSGGGGSYQTGAGGAATSGQGFAGGTGNTSYGEYNFWSSPITNSPLNFASGSFASRSSAYCLLVTSIYLL
jgi:hypothetical protein